MVQSSSTNELTAENLPSDLTERRLGRVPQHGAGLAQERRTRAGSGPRQGLCAGARRSVPFPQRFNKLNRFLSSRYTRTVAPSLVFVEQGPISRGDRGRSPRCPLLGY